MKPIDVPGTACPHCGYDNKIRHNGPGMLGETVLKDQYQVGRMLGRGGFGVTYMGYDLNLKRRVAIKEYYPGQLVAREAGKETLSAVTGSEEDYRRGCQRALRESQVAANLGQIYGVVQVYNVFTTNNTVYIIMEYVEGETLTKLVESRKTKPTIQEAIQLLQPVKVGNIRIAYPVITVDNLVIFAGGVSKTHIDAFSMATVFLVYDPDDIGISLGVCIGNGAGAILGAIINDHDFHPFSAGQ